MSEEQLRILEMLREGKVGAQEAAELLRAVTGQGSRRHRRDRDGESMFGRIAGKLGGMKVIPGSAKFEEKAEVRGPLTIGGGAKFQEEVNIKGPLSVGGGVKFQANVQHSGALNCGGVVKFEGEAKVDAGGINVGGALKFSDKAEVSVKDKIRVRGDLVLEPGAQLSVTGDIVVEGKVINKADLSASGAHAAGEAGTSQEEER